MTTTATYEARMSGKIPILQIDDPALGSCLIGEATRSFTFHFRTLAELKATIAELHRQAQEIQGG